jgi:hypothetical protein
LNAVTSNSWFPAAVSRNPGQLDLFVAGNDGCVYTSWWTAGGDWSGRGGWENIGGLFPRGAPVSVVSRNPGQLDLFIVGHDGCVYTCWWTAGGDWSGRKGWENIGGVFPVGATVSVVARDADQLDLFIVGNDGCVYTAWWTAGRDWSGRGGWDNIGGLFPIGAPIAAVARNPEQLDLFVAGGDGCVYTSWWSADRDWSGRRGWRNIGGLFPIGAPISAVSRNPDQLDVFIVGGDGCVYTSWWTAGRDWSGLQGWRNIGGVFPIGGPVAAVSRNADQLDLFVIGNNGIVYTSWWTAGSDWSGLQGWRSVGGVFPIPIPSFAFYTFTLERFIIHNTRSAHEDTDYVSFTLAIGDGAPQTQFRSMGDLNNGTYDVGLSFGPAMLTRFETAVFNYIIVNAGNIDPGSVEKILENAGANLAKEGVQVGKQALFSGNDGWWVGAEAGMKIGEQFGPPIYGPLMTGLVGFVSGLLGFPAFADCDGPVAVEQAGFTGEQIWTKTGLTNPFAWNIPQPGIDSPAGCGSNSVYETRWSIKRL